MEDLIIISNLNDFIFCPASIYFHKLYGSQDNLLYQSSAQLNGTKAHETIDEKIYSTRKSAMMSLDVYSEKYGLCGKIVGFSICLMSTTFKVYEVLGQEWKEIHYYAVISMIMQEMRLAEKLSRTK